MRVLNRRLFFRCAAVGLAGVSAGLDARAAEKGFIQTVRGPIAPEKFGFALAHEHVICDFIGAEKTGRDRWDVDAVVTRMRPILAQLKQRRVTGFVDCTPAYIGRDPRILQKLARQTGLHIITNTGYYGGASDKYVPKHAYSESADQLAARWIGEWKDGIEGTGVKPGFIKIGVDEAKEDRLSEIDEKLVRAAARASLQTGLTVVCHTGGGAAGLTATKIFISEKARAGRFAVAHSDGHGLHINQQVAELGAWVSFDGISRRPIEQHLKLVASIVEKHADRLLLSHDNGWYNVGETNGGEVRDFNYLADSFLPALRANGVSEQMVRQLTIGNPAKAFTIDS
jgi:predicted metal-dependent phosphotriesterase family hydrolase